MPSVGGGGAIVAITVAAAAANFQMIKINCIQFSWETEEYRASSVRHRDETGEMSQFRYVTLAVATHREKKSRNCCGDGRWLYGIICYDMPITTRFSFCFLLLLLLLINDFSFCCTDTQRNQWVTYDNLDILLHNILTREYRYQRQRQRNAMLIPSRNFSTCRCVQDNFREEYHMRFRQSVQTVDWTETNRFPVQSARRWIDSQQSRLHRQIIRISFLRTVARRWTAHQHR